jgi:hypothetical protein
MSTGIPPGTASTSLRRLCERLNEKSLGEDLQFFFAIIVVTSIVYVLLPLFMGFYPENEFKIGMHQIGFMVLGAIISLLQGLMTGAITLLGISLIEHFFLLFVDVHQGFEKTMKSVIYALAPCILLSWVVIIVKAPFSGLLLLLGFGLMTYPGVQVFHEMSKDRAVFVSLATSAVLAILFSRWISGPGLLL